MNYQETIDYLYARLPMFTRDGAAAFKKDLGNTIALCEALGNPHERFKSIHIAGTNGKGSTSHSLSAILQASGYKTGLYTSPHLIDFRERIRIDGRMIPHENVVGFVARHRELIERIQPSFFELTVALAFDFFAREKVDIAVIETGLGGRLDSTNIIHPVLSLITNIGNDHADMLGDTLQKIAFEKAGIIKAGVPVVVSEYQPEVAAVFADKAAEERVALFFAAKEWEVRHTAPHPDHQLITLARKDDDTHDPERGGSGESRTFRLDLQGRYQAKNLPGILRAVDLLRDTGWVIPEEKLREGLAQVQSMTGLRGRWQILSRQPLLVCDTGHNEDGWREILRHIAMTPHRQLHVVFGVMKDKDLGKMLPMLPKDAFYYCCQVSMPRAMPTEQLVSKAFEYGLKGRGYATVSAAVAAAKMQATPEDMIFVGGSTFIVGEFLSLETTGD